MWEKILKQLGIVVTSLTLLKGLLLILADVQPIIDVEQGIVWQYSKKNPREEE